MTYEIDFGEYFDYATLGAHLKGLAAAYPALAALEVIGSSWRGRDIYCMTITNAKTGPHDSKPAFYIDGGIHAEEVATTQTAVYTIWYLLSAIWRRCRCYLAAGPSCLLYHPAHQPRWRRNQPENGASLVWQRPLPARRRADSWFVPARYRRRRLDRADAPARPGRRVACFARRPAADDPARAGRSRPETLLSTLSRRRNPRRMGRRPH